MSETSWRMTAAGIAVWFGGAVFSFSLFAGLAVFGHQTYIWLRFGEWVSLNALTIFTWFELPWAHTPQDWIGVHRALEAIPLSLSFPIGGGALFITILLVSIAFSTTGES